MSGDELNHHEAANRRMRLIAAKRFKVGTKTRKGIAELEGRMRMRFGEKWGDQMVDLSNPLVIAMCSVIDKLEVRNPVTFFGALRLAAERMLATTTGGAENVYEACERTLGWLPISLTEGELGELMDDIELLSELSAEGLDSLDVDDPYREDDDK